MNTRSQPNRGLGSYPRSPTTSKSDRKRKHPPTTRPCLPILSRSSTPPSHSLYVSLTLRLVHTPRIQRQLPCRTQIINSLPPFCISEQVVVRRRPGDVSPQGNPPGRAHVMLISQAGPRRRTRGTRRVQSRGQPPLQRRRSQPSRHPQTTSSFRSATVPLSGPSHRCSYILLPPMLRKLPPSVRHGAECHGANVQRAFTRLTYGLLVRNTRRGFIKVSRGSSRIFIYNWPAC